MLLISIFCFILLFLYGIDLLTNYLESRFNSKSTYILNKFTSNIFMSFLVGIIITFFTQSSSAVTAIVISLLNANKLKLKNAISIMIGSNIGTTFTSLITGLNIDKYCFVFLAFGLILHFINKTKNISKLFVGLGFIFLSLFLLKLDLAKVLDSINYLAYFKKSNNSILLSTWNGILISGIIQSSSATIGLAQIAASNKLISLLSGICIVLGANIGTTFTGLIASIKSNDLSKALAVSHFLLNLFGVILVLPFVNLFSFNIYMQESVFLSFIHILFNLFSAILGIIFINPLMKVSLFLTKKKNLIDNY